MMPRLIRGLPAADYHAIPALSAGGAWTLDSECPAKFWQDSPWNPKREAVNATHFDIGTAVHLAILEPELFASRVVCHEHDDYRTKPAREIRDEAYAAGKTPLKPVEHQMVLDIAASIERHHAATRFLHDGDAEASLTWEWGAVPCKCRPDFLAADRSYVIDLKTAASANPQALARKAYTDGWFVRAPWYMAGVKAVTGILPDNYLFVVVEKDAPHLVEVYEMDDRALAFGEQIIARSLKRFAECMADGRWPSYGNGQIATLKLPTWAEFQRAEREEAGEFC